MVWLNPNTWPAESGMLSRTTLRNSSRSFGGLVRLVLLLDSMTRADGRRNLSAQASDAMAMTAQQHLTASLRHALCASAKA